MGELVMRWVDGMPTTLPKRSNQRYNWAAVAAELRTQPGEWMLVATDISRSHARAIRDGKKPAFQPPEDWLVETKGPRGNSGDLYMCFIGAQGARMRAEEAR